MQLLGGEQEQAEHGANGVSELAEERPAGATLETPIASTPSLAPPAGAERELAELRERVARLEREMESLKAELGVGADS